MESSVTGKFHLVKEAIFLDDENWKILDSKKVEASPMVE